MSFMCCISLVANEKSLRDRLSKDIERVIRTVDVIERSVARIPLKLIPLKRLFVIIFMDAVICGRRLVLRQRD